jgi:hypothetical protein
VQRTFLPIFIVFALCLNFKPAADKRSSAGQVMRTVWSNSTVTSPCCARAARERNMCMIHGLHDAHRIRKILRVTFA